MRGGAVVVIGSPGIGKSTLVEEFTRRARAQHVPVLAGRTADHDGAPAFWPWIRALSGDSAARLALSPVLLDVDPVGDAQIAAAVRFAAIARCAKALVTAGSGNGLIVTLEDMQWADDASIALFRYLCRDGPAAGLLILATTREPVPDGLAGLPDTALWRLQPFTRAEVAEYLGATAHPSWAREVHDRSAGLPLLVREIAATLGETRLAAPSGPAPCLPTGLGPVFDLRAGRLSPQCRMLLDGASALDDDADVALLDARPGALAQALGTGFVRQDAEVPGR